MPITVQEVDQIAERWDKGYWDAHEQAFARQWMAQAQDDVRTLVEVVRELQEKAEGVAEDAQVVADKQASRENIVQLAADAEEVAVGVGELGDALEGVSSPDDSTGKDAASGSTKSADPDRPKRFVRGAAAKNERGEIAASSSDDS